MRAREVVPSVGAGGSLIAAGIVCMLLFSSLLAFRAWPDRVPARPDGSATLRAPAAKADGRAASGPLLLAQLAPASAGGPDAGEPVSDRPRRRRPSPPAPGGGSGPGPGPVIPVSTAPDGGAVPVTDAAPPARGGGSNGGGGGGGGGGGVPALPPVDPPAQPAPGTVESLAETGRGIVEPIVEPLPPLVQEPVATVLDSTESAAQVVDETLDDTLGLLVP